MLVIIVFFCFIPVFIFMCLTAKKIYHETPGQKDIALTPRDGTVYVDDMRMDITYDARDHEVNMDARRSVGRHGCRKVIFYAAISGDAVEGFLAFCRENGVVMEVVDESEL